MLLNTPLILRHHANLRDQFQRYPLARFYSNFNELQDLVRRTRRHEEMREGALPRKDGAGLVAGRKFLFVVAWFGAKVRGGHESFIFELCTELSHRGAEVEVWTTASTNLNHRNQDALRDSEEESRLPFRIRRFPANDRIEWLFNGIHGRLFNRGVDFPVVRALWKYSNLYGKGMKEMLLAESGRFDAIHLCHYLLGTSHRLGGLVPWKTLLHPAIHDEPPLHSRLMGHLFAGSAGVLCSTPAEVELARQGPCGLVPELYPVIGIGIRPAKEHPPQRLAKVDIFSQQGYLIFIGRLIREKNVPLLLKWHKSLTESLPNPPGLVLIGEGDLADKINWNEWPNTIHLPWIAPGEKRYALENALALVQPSLLESFSLVVMEAWQHGTPVIVHRHCRATHYHVEESRGGVAVATAAEYAHAVERFQDDPQQRKKCGEQGHRYVNEHYSWDAVIDRFGREVSHLLDWNGQHGTRP